MSDALKCVAVLPLSSGHFVLVDTDTDCAFGPVLREPIEVVDAFLATLGPDPRFIARHLLQESWAQFRASKETPR